MKPWQALILILFIVAVTVYARSKLNPPPHEISGQVTSQGEPVSSGIVTFENARTEKLTAVELDPGGHYSARLPTGVYLITVTPLILKGAGSEADTETFQTNRVIPDKYWITETSGLRETITSNNDSLNFNLIAPPKRKGDDDEPDLLKELLSQPGLNPVKQEPQPNQ